MENAIILLSEASVKPQVLPFLRICESHATEAKKTASRQPYLTGGVALGGAAFAATVASRGRCQQLVRLVKQAKNM
ncbi:hypothetical protein MAR_011519 [Mya arenaria]|uniref:Uncharacterized protein n=1 Tax=Mya arenaria TaxID=6604 RepID=A0ABY7FV28_MYAAR|nr:hypothetical protein MAR_011519 [Mya arenaria]